MVSTGGLTSNEPAFLGPTAGDGQLLVVASGRRCIDPSFEPCDGTAVAGPYRERLRRLAGDRLVLLASGHGSYKPVDVDANRVLVLTRPGAVRILDAKGRLLRSFAFRGATSAQLSGDDLVVVRGDTLEVWDVPTGERRAAYPLERGFGPVPVVEDAEQGIASVVIGRRHPPDSPLGR